VFLTEFVLIFAGVLQIAMDALISLDTEDELKANQLSQTFSIVWALCHGNGQHTDAVCNNEGFFQNWLKTVDDCIANGDRPVLASLCLGVGATVFVKSRKQRTKLIQASVPAKLALLLRNHPENVPVLVQSLVLLDDLNEEPTMQRSQDVIDALKNALENWKLHHQKQKQVTCAVLETISSFVKHLASALSQWGIPELVSASLKFHHDDVAMQNQGRVFLESMRKADSRHRRGSILPISQLRPEQKKVPSSQLPKKTSC
jgi:hypothetical protein